MWFRDGCATIVLNLLENISFSKALLTMSLYVDGGNFSCCRNLIYRELSRPATSMFSSKTASHIASGEFQLQTSTKFSLAKYFSLLPGRIPATCHNRRDKARSLSFRYFCCCGEISDIRRRIAEQKEFHFPFFFSGFCCARMRAKALFV